MILIQFFPLGSCGYFVLFSIRWLDFLVFWLGIFKLFRVKAHSFRRPFVICTFCLWCNHGALKLIAPARGCPASVIGHVKTSRDYIKIEQFRTWLLSSSLAEFQQLYSKRFFHFCFSFFPPACMGSSSVFALGVLWLFGFFSMEGIEFLIFLSEIFKLLPR